MRSFLVETLNLHSHAKSMDYFEAEAGLMPVSFQVVRDAGEERLEADFGAAATLESLQSILVCDGQSDFVNYRSFDPFAPKPEGHKG